MCFGLTELSQQPKCSTGFLVLSDFVCGNGTEMLYDAG
jgi:hypothetical protein